VEDAADGEEQKSMQDLLNEFWVHLRAGGGPRLQTPLDRLSQVLGDQAGIFGGRWTNCSACAGGAMVVGEAFERLRAGEGQVAVAGAAVPAAPRLTPRSSATAPRWAARRSCPTPDAGQQRPVGPDVRLRHLHMPQVLPAGDDGLGPIAGTRPRKQRGRGPF
jgi:hypothetical protein